VEKQGVPDGLDRVSVSEATPERVKGTFAGRGVSMKFDTVSTPAVKYFVLSSADDEELYRAEQIGDEITMEVFGGRAKTIVNLAIIKESERLGANPEEDPGDFSTANGIVQSGDPEAFEEFEQTAEFLALPYLSFELGKAGKDGGSFTSTAALHWLAMSSAMHQELDFEAFRSDEGRESLCTDLRSDPCGNQSLGMCGPGTSCWQWTCGDCCCHSGCKSHDITCRNCKWYKPWNCALCWTGLSMFGGLCGTCESCGSTEYYEPACVPPGEFSYCSSDSQCCGHVDGSSEYGQAPLGAFCGYDGKCHTCWDGSVAMTYRCH
jgi:hypothetical protein